MALLIFERGSLSFSSESWNVAAGKLSTLIHISLPPKALRTFTYKTFEAVLLLKEQGQSQQATAAHPSARRVEQMLRNRHCPTRVYSAPLVDETGDSYIPLLNLRCSDHSLAASFSSSGAPRLKDVSTSENDIPETTHFSRRFERHHVLSGRREPVLSPSFHRR